MNERFRRKFVRCSRQRITDGLHYIERIACRLGFLSAGLLLSFLVSCSNADPEILQIDSDLLLYRGDPAYEQLSLFVRVDDADGRGEINELYVYHDRMQLVWYLDADSWESHDESDGFWIGYPALFMPGGAPFPRGSYRVVVADLSGREASLSFALPPEETAHAENRAPRYSEGEGIFVVEGDEQLLVRNGESGFDLYRTAPGEASEADRRILADREGYFVEAQAGRTVLTPLRPVTSQNP